ncbi:MAG: pyridoxamine 5'-phosphate oxidase family protein [Acidobacteriota bacterium]
MDAAREVAATDPVAALVTVDSKGRPRARSVEVHWEEIVLTDPPLFGHNPPEGARRETDRIMLWIATRPGTRKLEQIAANPRVALYFEDDASGSYLSVMGWAEIITEPRVVTTQSWHNEEQLAEFYPSFPDDMVLIRVDVSWLEVIAPGIDASTDLWRPQAAVLQAETPDPE